MDLSAAAAELKTPVVAELSVLRQPESLELPALTVSSVGARRQAEA
jgi:hypothetical protein